MLAIENNAEAWRAYRDTVLEPLADGSNAAVEVEVTAGTMGEARTTLMDEIELGVSEVHTMRKDSTRSKQWEMVVYGSITVLCGWVGWWEWCGVGRGRRKVCKERDSRFDFGLVLGYVRLKEKWRMGIVRGAPVAVSILWRVVYITQGGEKTISARNGESRCQNGLDEGYHCFMIIGLVKFEVPDVLDEFLGILHGNLPAGFYVIRRTVSVHVAFLQ
jgi:hypothetical protein